MYEIEIANNQSLLDVDERMIRRAVEAVLSAEKIRAATISVALVDDAAIHQLNREYLNHNYPTDVLSFALEAEAGRLEGEIVVSTETAIRQADEFDAVGVDQELLLYIIHGTLHLTGYDDHSEDDRRRMREQEQRHLAVCSADAARREAGRETVEDN